MDKAKMNELYNRGHYYSVPKGVSMWPLIKSQENVIDIVPVSGELKRYDVALYYRKSEDRYVLHRILKVEDDYYIFMGITAGVRRLFLRIRLSVLLLSITAKAGGLMLMIYALRYMHIYGAMRYRCVVRF